MTKRTVTIEACDECGKELRAPGDGLVIRGQVYAVAASVGQQPLVGDMSGDEHALCWKCWHTKVRDSAYTDACSTIDRYVAESYKRG